MYCVKTHGSPIYCYSNSLGILSLKVSCMQIEHFSRAVRLLFEKYFGMTNSSSTHDKNIAHGSGLDIVKSAIVQYVFRTL